MTINPFCSVSIEGTIVYTFFSAYALGVSSFVAAGVPILSAKTLLVPLLFSAIMSAGFLGLFIFSSKKLEEIRFPFIVTHVLLPCQEEDKTIEE